LICETGIESLLMNLRFGPHKRFRVYIEGVDVGYRWIVMGPGGVRGLIQTAQARLRDG
jgi:hypothetical protein